MNLCKALKTITGMRVSNGDKWLVWSVETNRWELWQHKYGARGSSLIGSSESCDNLVESLIRDEVV